MNNILINYIEFTSDNLEKTREFYGSLFGWKFTDYGPTYTSFSESGIAGGFALDDGPVTNGALVVLYHTDLESLVPRIKEAGGAIAKDIFPFPGGRRFHFKDPAGNELAVWSDK